ncbi:proton myo-inositol cotransporter-like [Paramacrobiotus metropolitanus]|uniref:proton myo-inositol cotransporter-like n=1 Tax=Paramacrobiotus metropolitanus TaxID=2943436 RepID=UPI0024455F03|nr:proton myo-inositol cotransporter-like [Paramacrobiotus metropolitanus]XP_055345919.1 proton myo-inositol cotransporter-like [Paramacrobiotus metropolitanus]XP_055345920.1 proton myo-inositol cotransporter-like [Paramacrobiotus metropolitanus]
MPSRIMDDVESDEERLAIDRVRRYPTKFAYLSRLLTGVGGFLIGYDAGVISGAMLIIKEEFTLTYVWQTMLISCTVLLAACSALMASFLSDRFGRRPVILCASFLFCLASLLESWATSISVLLSGRILIGVSFGLTSATSLIYFSELSPEIPRKNLLPISLVIVSGGQLTGSVIDGICGLFDSYTWRIMLGLGCIPSVAQLIGFIFMPESPLWLTIQGRYEDAKSGLYKLRGINADIDEEFDLLKLAAEERIRNRPKGSTRWMKNDMLWQPAFRRTLLVGCGLHAIVQFTGGINLLYYGGTVIQMTGLNGKATIIWLTAVTNVIGLLGSFVGLCLTDRLGRRPLMLLSLFGVLMSLVVLAVSFQLGAVNSPLVTYRNEPLSTGSSSSSGTGGPSVSEICRSQINCEACIEQRQCGFCYVSNELESVSQASCTDAAEEDFTHAAKGRCYNVTTAARNNLFWSFDACPTSYTWVPLYGLMLYLMFFAAGVAPGSWVASHEIYSPTCRDTGIIAAVAATWFSAFITTSTFLYLVQAIFKFGIFWLYASVAVLGLFFIYFAVPETKGRKAEEVEGLFAMPFAQAANAVLPLEKPVQFVRIRGLNRDGQQDSVESDDSD